MRALLSHLEQKQDLTPAEVAEMAACLLDENVAAEEKANLLAALAQKGETAAELTHFVEIFLGHAVEPGLSDLGLEVPTIDVCGTGGDRLNLFNVSTTSMFVAAAAGAVVVKHGNRGITSQSGGADVLEALGLHLEMPMSQWRECVRESGVGFLFAPACHPAFKAVAAARALLARRGQRSLFNLIGPLMNPARPRYQLVGVVEKALCPIYASILRGLGRECAWVVNGNTAVGEPVDEMSAMAATSIWQTGVAVPERHFTVEPEDLGITRVAVEDLRGGNASENARILREVITGQDQSARRSMVLLNAAAALTCVGIAPTLEDGLLLAARAIDSGDAAARLECFLKVGAAR